DEREAAPHRVLPLGHVDLKHRVGVQTLWLRLPDDADDLARELLVAPDGDVLADGVFAGEDLARQRLVDDGDHRRARVVALREGAPAKDGDAQRAEVVGRDDRVGGVIRLLGRERTALAYEGAPDAEVAAVQGERKRRRRRLDAGQRPDARD